ncbi:iron ABC transporter permease [Berryella wangjianweii]|uniref:Iron ABC transporter permease n=1 Tax=Berryella wangjianweii TaxID=2734634 RepID=A0A6M8IZT8_9ACTN|nr:iron ABC transporter permease [Berryella wangjianweii]NPD32211.1 iron ABC transporter permease [Eggerthellaceae bacterium zg-997]QKF07230.1 iron ABC transporter permease [Berryella wangjianweii]
MKHEGSRCGSAALTAAFAVLPAALFVASLGLGPYALGPMEVAHIVVGKALGMPLPYDALAVNVVWQVRLPRVMAAMLVGAGLAVAGAVFQGVFRNPLASPYTLGVSNGAGFGAALAIVLSLGGASIQAFAIAFGLAAVGLTFLFAARSRQSTVALVLSGMLVGSLFASLVALLKFTADPTEKLPQIVYWIMGSLSGTGFDELLRIAPLYAVCMAVLVACRWRVNVLSVGDHEARSFGVDVRRDRGVLVAAASALAALAVSVSGIIGWVGIVVPHLARMLVGPDFRRLVPAAVSLGASYLMVIDDACRSFVAAEVPIGVVTGIVGVPLFLYFIFKGRVSW